MSLTQNMLHITNGESVSLPDTGLPGEIAYWMDPLNEGPVPEGLALRELSRLRARHHAERGRLGVAGMERDFRARDQALEQCGQQGEVVLWFEHDLYDQLQLIQLLDWFAQNKPGPERLTLVQANDYLGCMAAEALTRLFPSRREVTETQLEIAARAWRAFRAPDPRGLVELLRSDTSALPYLADALLRHLQQFPSSENGLSRTERQILETLSAGPCSFHQLFLTYQRREERLFLGDVGFRGYVEDLERCIHPLVAERDREWHITEMGRRVIAREEDHIRQNGIDRWLGGVHLHAGEAIWRWDDGRRTIYC